MRAVSMLFLASVACQAQAGEIEVVVEGGQLDRDVRVALYNAAAGFSEDRDGKYAYRVMAIKSTGSTTRFIFTQLPAGRYAISAFQDNNGNQRLDSNFVGMPTEPYAHSRAARNLFRAPSFDQASFDLGEAKVTQQIHLK